MDFADIAERARRIAAQNYPGVPVQAMCAWVWTRVRPEGGDEFRCSVCGDTQVIREYKLGGIEQRECRG